ncbi:MAG TPA: FAD-dependent oxidoreductase [Candidatus Baltobacteraceae bacterium]|nr:FAD-dependent oxidoreductase [Candidatus Baltobacteraceae bacterium]
MPKYLCRVIRREEIAQGTLAVTLERPPEFQFAPGQYATFTLLDPPETDAEGNTRTFSLASAPFEQALVFATRLRDTAFKRVLRQIPVGSALRLNGPAGGFTLHADASRPAVFLAGGIGITPFMSMIKQVVYEATARDLFLFYANRRPEDSAFLQTLQALADSARTFRFIPTFTSPDVSGPVRGERGRIDAPMLVRHLPDLRGPLYYAAGPPAMVEAMRDLLTQAGVGPQDIQCEEFPGYL